MEIGYDEDTEPECFVLGKIFIKNSDVLIGWDNFENLIIIPWEEIKSIKQAR